MVAWKQVQATGSHTGKFSETSPAHEPTSHLTPPAPSPRRGLKEPRVAARNAGSQPAPQNADEVPSSSRR